MRKERQERRGRETERDVMVAIERVRARARERGRSGGTEKGRGGTRKGGSVRERARKFEGERAGAIGAIERKRARESKT